MDGLLQFAPLVLIFVVFYFLMIRPQQRKQKEHQAMVRAAKRGDRIVTSGGILGVITKANDADNDVEVEIAQGIKVRVVRSAISDIVNRTPEAAKTVTKDGAKDSKSTKDTSKQGANDA
ncbi:MAG TPA: preprotein translocase subunit YajC [Candidatus Cybelea sp.]|nr:preprotein translocase subunit YajC [Candidatus Cybelea sp.]